MPFSDRLVALRKASGLTQQALADRAGLHGTLVRRYEIGKVQPSIDALRRLAVALSVPADLLLFEEDERGPDDDLRLQFEAVQRFDPEEKAAIRQLIEGMILKHEAKRWAAKG